MIARSGRPSSPVVHYLPRSQRARPLPRRQHTRLPAQFHQGLAYTIMRYRVRASVRSRGCGRGSSLSQQNLYRTGNRKTGHLKAIRLVTAQSESNLRRSLARIDRQLWLSYRARARPGVRTDGRLPCPAQARVMRANLWRSKQKQHHPEDSVCRDYVSVTKMTLV